jgi:hypothetical protein
MASLATLLRCLDRRENFAGVPGGSSPLPLRAGPGEGPITLWSSPKLTPVSRVERLTAFGAGTVLALQENSLAGTRFAGFRVSAVAVTEHRYGIGIGGVIIDERYQH